MHSRKTMKQLYFIIGILFFNVTISHTHNCDRTPKKAEDPKTNADRYVIEVSGNPETYSPGANYSSITKIFSLMLCKRL